MDPILVLEIPFDRFADSLLEGIGGFPAEFLFDFSCVDGVAAVVTGAIFDEGNELTRVATEIGSEFVDQIANEFNDMDVGPFVVAADVVSLAGSAALQNLPERFRVITNKEPVTDVHAVAINRKRFAMDEILDNDRNELFGKLVRAVVIGAVGDDGIKPVSMMVSANEHVARGFTGGVRRVRGVRSGFSEVTRGAEAAIHFVRGDVMKAIRGGRRRTNPEFPASFEKIEGANDIRRDEVAGAGDGAVDVRLRSEMHDVGNLMPTKDFADGVLIAKIDLFKDVFGMRFGLFEVGEMTGVGKTVEIHQPSYIRLVDYVLDNIAADETGTACKKKVHVAISLKSVGNLDTYLIRPISITGQRRFVLAMSVRNSSNAFSKESRSQASRNVRIVVAP